MRSLDTIKNALRTATTIRPLKLATGGDVSAPAVDYSKPDDLGMYSHGAVVASKMPIAKGTPQQIKGYLTKQGVKPDEFKWSGYDEKLGGKPSVTREEVAKHFHENKPAIRKHILRDSDYNHDDDGTGNAPKYSDYTLPGGANYREHLLTLPEKRSAHKLRADTLSKESHRRQLTPDEFDELDAARAASAHEAVPEQYRSSHWDQPNVLAHLRLSDRDLPNKQKALHLEELQSDWAQEGRTKGFKGLTPDEEIERAQLRERQKHPDYSGTEIARHQALNMKEVAGIPRAPYVDSTAKWTDLGLKRALYEAAKGGHSKLLITPGEEQAKRYDLSKQIKELSYNPDKKYLMMYTHNGDDHMVDDVAPEDLDKHVGKDVAKKLLASGPHPNAVDKNTHHLSGVDLKVGGEGMKAFYDKMLPQALQKLAKKHDPAAEVKLHGHELLDPTYKKEPGYRVMTGGASGTPMHDSHFITRQGAERRRQEFIAQGHPADALSVETTQPSTKLHSLDITPKMRESILKGHPHFESGGAVPGYASGGAVNHAPTEAQKEAGNYRKKHISFQGLNIAIENEKGSVRTGASPSGKSWRCVVSHAYGYIKNSRGADGEHVDCYIGPEEDSTTVFVINQCDPNTKKFDETKCMLGFKDEEDALCGYVAGFSDGSGPKRIGSVETMSVDAFKRWLAKGHRHTMKPVPPGSAVDHALAIAKKHAHAH